MDLNISKPLVFFDIEATGLNVNSDRIVEISILKIHPDGREENHTYKVNPTIPIEHSATKVHGITDNDVKDWPKFAEVAPQIAQFIKGCNMAGYNSNKFDIPLLAEEFIRANVDVDFKKMKFVDVQVIFFKMEQRTLKAAYKFYCDKDLKDAHSAQSDTYATYEVLKSQLERYPELKNEVNFLADYTTKTRFADFAGRLSYDDKGVEVFNFGKYKGKPVVEVFEQDKGYYSWMMNGDFPLYTKKVLTAIKLGMAFKNTNLSQ